MSRTVKDKPWRVLRAMRTEAWRFSGGYPPAVGGAWEGMSALTRAEWKSFRVRTKQAMRRGGLPPRPHRRDVKWHWW